MGCRLSLPITVTTGPIGGRGHDGRDREQTSPGGRCRDLYGPISSLTYLGNTQEFRTIDFA